MSFKEMSQKQLDTARARFDTMIARMGEGREAYQPFITSLKDQIQFLGRDLSPEALGALDEAATKVMRRVIAENGGTELANQPEIDVSQARLPASREVFDRLAKVMKCRSFGTCVVPLCTTPDALTPSALEAPRKLADDIVG